eukprot:NODE_2116_length_1203_cov_4.820624_g1754_i0.p1 GENE.NODE_2116_length_1203_cov_4.820624_g1754_i0~~NODE_2116_length_1203_cov_4.820624_g1754_i0.p1  ORF type:complete len:295 (+),score=17.84 NODE_2116_length_1203_cov_4.820624_g1754_i0:226-1110(+)
MPSNPSPPPAFGLSLPPPIPSSESLPAAFPSEGGSSFSDHDDRDRSKLAQPLLPPGGGSSNFPASIAIPRSNSPPVQSSSMDGKKRNRSDRGVRASKESIPVVSSSRPVEGDSPKASQVLPTSSLATPLSSQVPAPAPQPPKRSAFAKNPTVHPVPPSSQPGPASPHETGIPPLPRPPKGKVVASSGSAQNSPRLAVMSLPPTGAEKDDPQKEADYHSTGSVDLDSLAWEAVSDAAGMSGTMGSVGHPKHTDLSKSANVRTPILVKPAPLRPGHHPPSAQTPDTADGARCCLMM